MAHDNTWIYRVLTDGTWQKVECCCQCDMNAQPLHVALEPDIVYKDFLLMSTKSRIYAIELLSPFISWYNECFCEVIFQGENVDHIE